MSKKYCVLPGQEPVRLASTAGHVVIVGETPREIPDIFIQEAKGKGCYTEEEVAAITSRLRGESSKSIQSGVDGQDQSHVSGETGERQSNNDSEPDERFAAIKNATIELLNTGIPEFFTTGNKPKVEELAKVLGFEVTAQERDAAFEAVTIEM